MTEQTKLMKPIWFFVGLILLVIGALVLLAGILDWLYPPAVPTTLAHLHPGVWWGALMMAFGAALLLPKRNRRGI